MKTQYLILKCSFNKSYSPFLNYSFSSLSLLGIRWIIVKAIINLRDHTTDLCIWETITAVSVSLWKAQELPGWSTMKNSWQLWFLGCSSPSTNGKQWLVDQRGVRHVCSGYTKGLCHPQEERDSSAAEVNCKQNYIELIDQRTVALGTLISNSLLEEF